MPGRPDSRNFERFELTVPAELTGDHHRHPYLATIFDIGLGGVQLQGKDELPVGVQLTLRIGEREAQPTAFGGEVRYSNKVETNGTFVSGFKFVPQTSDERARIAEFVSKVFQQAWANLDSD